MANYRSQPLDISSRDGYIALGQRLLACIPLSNRRDSAGSARMIRAKGAGGVQPVTPVYLFDPGRLCQLQEFLYSINNLPELPVFVSAYSPLFFKIGHNRLWIMGGWRAATHGFYIRLGPYYIPTVEGFFDPVLSQ
ncbi:MAG: hypothetical protein ACOY3Z_10425 [Thermodesulfobacteriota bacterium]